MCSLDAFPHWPVSQRILTPFNIKAIISIYNGKFIQGHQSHVTFLEREICSQAPQVLNKSLSVYGRVMVTCS